jgi:hypothetical protein
MKGVASLQSRGHVAEILVLPNLGNRAFSSAAAALNHGICQLKPEYVVCLHEDIIGEWGNYFDFALDIKGISGMVGRDTNYVWGRDVTTPYPIQTLDECCFSFPNEYLFDDITCNHWHQYGPDLCLQAIARGNTNYIVPCQLDHVGGFLSIAHDGANFHEQLTRLRKKWAGVSIVRT